MSQSSGRAGAGEFRESFDRAEFTDAVSGVEYRISVSREGYRLGFSRAGSDVRGQRILSWFIGSGRVGRSYLSSLDGFLFQSPVSYYTQTAKWDISPGFRRYTSAHLTRAVETGCLRCHASRLQPVAGTQNRFASPPFLEFGIGCERCHGPGREHVERMTSGNGKGAGIVNPRKLDPVRRDSICAQCHLTGAARIARMRGKQEVYRPGLSLPDFSAFFVWSGAESPGLRVNSHFEKLQQSACKRASGDALWCGSCHDPHEEPEASKRPEYYHARCERCHESRPCKESAQARRQAQDDCVACHMPKNRVEDAEHAVYTDHSIPRRPGRTVEPIELLPAARRSLVSFWKTPVDERDLGLAYAAVAGEDPGLRRRALDLLRKSENREPADVAVLIQLAQLYDMTGEPAKAMGLCERILRLDPAQASVAITLGAYYAQRARAPEAMRLWKDALSRNPGMTEARVNLAVAQFRTGDRRSAEATLLTALEYDPDADIARKLLAEFRNSRSGR